MMLTPWGSDISPEEEYKPEYSPNEGPKFVGARLYFLLCVLIGLAVGFREPLRKSPDEIRKLVSRKIQNRQFKQNRREFGSDTVTFVQAGLHNPVTKGHILIVSVNSGNGYAVYEGQAKKTGFDVVTCNMKNSRPVTVSVSEFSGITTHSLSTQTSTGASLAMIQDSRADGFCYDTGASEFTRIH